MSKESGAMNEEKAVEIFKALSNQTRVRILQMLKQPETYFAIQAHVKKEDGFQGGVCVSDICSQIGLSQSTTSQYLSLLQQNGLVEMKRIGQWTYYRRNEETLKQFEQFINRQL